jgi:hypothetical protein
MRKALIGVTSALALAGSAIALSTPASAFPVWVVPAIVAAGVGGIGVGAAAGSANAATTGSILPPPAVVQTEPQVTYGAEATVRPGCHPARERIGGIWRRVEICP